MYFSTILMLLCTKFGLSFSRLKVDAQPTSFEANEQFKIFQRFVAVPFGEQVVFKFTSLNAVNIMIRSINLSHGGREYLVYPDDDNVTFTGTLTDANVLDVNGNLQDSGLSEHPTSLVTVGR